MPRVKQYLVVVGALALVGAVVYLAHRTRPQPQPPRPEAKALAGLAWLPAESGLVAGIDLREVRRQGWLLEMIRQAGGEEKWAPDYQAFVEATGFDYTRDLDRLWVGVFGPSEEPVVVGVAEGRFARDKILAHARRQGARLNPHRGTEIYQVRTGLRNRSGAPGRFAFAFLDDTHLAFANDARGAAQVVDCWRGQAPAVGSDPVRRAGLEQLAAGQQAWAVDDLAKWQPPGFRDQESLRALVAQAALGLRVSGAGLEVEGEARCHDPRQAARLRDNLRVLTLVGRLALSRQQAKSSQALGEVLGKLELTREGDTLRAHVILRPELLAGLLGTSVSSPARP